MTAELPHLPGGWHEVLAPAVESPWFRQLWDYVQAERERGPVFPPADEVFSALALAPWGQVKLVIVGQDPYHDEGQAHGLCFSVKPGVRPPPSLRNMFKELEADLGVPPPGHGNLEAWARQGVLLLNTVLTVRAHQAASHKGHGWEHFTDAVIAALDAGPHRLVFALWGKHAQQKGKRIDRRRHVVLEAAHPSPLSARLFLGSKPFSAIDAALAELGHERLRWRLP
jgi:uracil-DNA glycosylase